MLGRDNHLAPFVGLIGMSLPKSVTVRIKGAGIHRRCSSVLQVFATMWAMGHELGNRDANHGGGGRMDHHAVADLAITRGKVRPRDRRWLSYSSVPIFRWPRHRALAAPCPGNRIR